MPLINQPEPTNTNLLARCFCPRAQGRPGACYRPPKYIKTKSIPSPHGQAGMSPAQCPVHAPLPVEAMVQQRFTHAQSPSKVPSAPNRTQTCAR
jgi:hypothetical protein